MARLLVALHAGALALAALTAAAPASASDPGHGKAVFAAQCAMCHSAVRNGAPILGPTLFGVVGRHAASVPGFTYSRSMKGEAFVWTEDRLKAYLPQPKAMVPGTKMAFAGLKNPAQVDDLVAYLATLK